MKKVWLILGAFSLIVSCSGSKKVSKEQVLESITQAMCKKMVECQPNSMPSEEYCNTMMKTAISGATQDLPEVGTAQSTLDTCVKSISSSDCSALHSSEPPAGCDFLKKK